MLCWWYKPIRHGKSLSLRGVINLSHAERLVFQSQEYSQFFDEHPVSVKRKSTPPQPSLALKAPILCDELHEHNLLTQESQVF